MTTIARPAPATGAARLGRSLIWVAAAAAAVAAFSALPDALAADATTRFVEIWRVVGFATFSAIFAAMAMSPAKVPLGIWAAVIGNKLLLTVVAVAWGPAVAGTGSALWWDGALTLLLLSGYALTRKPR